uniref:Large ribosomal subunit protein bL34m n=1 Tax=Megaselia scalaris TaxID=36166 RepID=T1H6D9_MEGSC
FNRAILKNKVRTHFPKPREIKRINVHGWETRMSTVEGRRTLMRRILKGR